MSNSASTETETNQNVPALVNLDAAKESVDNALQKREITEESLKALVELYKDLTIEGPEDREGLMKVKRGRIVLKNKRVEIEKSAKALRDGANKFTKDVRDRELSLIAIIEPTEDNLYLRESNVEAQIEELAREEERKAAEKFQNRISSLAKFNYAVDSLELQLMSDERFADILKSAEEEFKKEQERKAEEERIAAEQRAAREKAEAEERERLVKVAEEQRILQEQLDKQRRDLDEKLQAAQKAQAELEQKLQEEREKLEGEKRAMEESKLLELKRIKDLGDQRFKQLLSYGYLYPGDDIAMITEDQYQTLLLDQRQLFEEEQQRKAIEKAEAERLEVERKEKEEAERREALKPDKEKLLAFAESIKSLGIPEMTTYEGQIIRQKAISYLGMASSHIKMELDKI